MKRKTSLLKDSRNNSGAIDITMTNYALDKDYLELKGSPLRSSVVNTMQQEPPDTQSPHHRGKGTKALLQQA